MSAGTSSEDYPGTTNRKPSRQLDNGQAPFAALRHAGPDIAQVEIPASHETTTPPPSAAGERTPQPHRESDQSRRDFAMACRLIETGRNDAEIGRAIVEVRRYLDSAKGERADDIERTIRAARRHVARHEEA